MAAASAGWLSARPRLLAATRLAALAAGLSVSLTTLHASRPGGTAALCAIIAGALSWLIWIVGGHRPATGRASLVTMAAAGGVMTASRGAGLVFVGISASSAAFAYDLPLAAAVACLSLLTWVTVTAVEDAPVRHIYELATIALLGLVSGSGRRQLLAHGQHESLPATAEQRAAVTRGEKELLAERNRLGREMHDVLAHALGAISIQLTALDSRVAAGEREFDVRERIAAIHRVVGDGLGEARDAMRALCDDGASLDDQLDRLCSLHGVVLDVQGPRTTEPKLRGPNLLRRTRRSPANRGPARRVR